MGADEATVMVIIGFAIDECDVVLNVCAPGWSRLIIAPEAHPTALSKGDDRVAVGRADCFTGETTKLTLLFLTACLGNATPSGVPTTADSLVFNCL